MENTMAGNQDKIIKTRPKTMKIFMFDVSLPWASFLFDLSNILLVVGACIVAVGTYGAITMGSVKERFADARTAEHEAKTAQAREAAALANQRASEADARAATANLELAKVRAPRTLSLEEKVTIAEALRRFNEQAYSALLPPAGLDTEYFWKLLDGVLARAGWLRANPSGLAIGDPPAGVSINAQPGIFIGYAASRKDKTGPAAVALAAALDAVGIAASAGIDNEAEKQPMVVKIVIGLKPL